MDTFKALYSLLTRTMKRVNNTAIIMKLKRSNEEGKNNSWLIRLVQGLLFLVSMVVNRFVFAATITGIVIYIEVTILQTTYNLGIETFTAATESTSLTQLEVLELAMTVASTFTREFLLGLLVAALLFLTFWRGSFTTIVTPWGGAISLNPKDRDNPLFDMDYLPEKMEIIVTMDTVVTEVMERLDAIEEPAITDVILECSLVYFKKKGVELRTVNVTNDSSKFLGFTTKYIPINYDDTTYYSYYSENKEIDDMDLFILKSFIYEVIVCNQKKLLWYN